MSVASWTLLGFTLLGLGETAREANLRPQVARLLIFAAATIALAYAFLRNTGVF